MIAIRIYDTDSVDTVARKIFHSFELYQSCKIEGKVEYLETGEVKDKGAAVLEMIKDLDLIHNHYEVREKGRAIRYKRKPNGPENLVGDRISNKSFTWVEKDGVYTIWRIQ